MGKAVSVTLFPRMMVVLIILFMSNGFMSNGPVWAAQSQSVATVHAFGSGKIRGEDMSAGRKEAIAASLVSAVTRALTDIAPPDLVAGHFQVINERIIAQTDRYILDYKLLAESTREKELQVMVRASVSIQRLKKTLKSAGIYVGRKSYPRVLICLAEKQMHQAGFQYWWGAQQMWRAGAATVTMTRQLEAKGFSLINPTISASRQGYAPQLSAPEAAALGDEMRADIVIVGTAVAEEGSGTSGSAVNTFRGSLTARAYRVKDGQEIGQIHHTATAANADPLSGGKEALENAARLAGDGLASQMVTAWFAGGSGASKVEVWVEGLSGNIANFVKFRGALSSMSGVDSVQRKEMKADTAVLSVDYQGNLQALSDALMRQRFDTFSLNIMAQEEGTIRLQLVPNQ